MLAAITWPMCENEIVEPISSVIVTASSSERDWRMPSKRSIASARSAGFICGQGPSSNASRAAPTAQSTSASRASGTRAITSSLCGLTTSIFAVDDGATHSPPMNSRSYVFM